MEEVASTLLSNEIRKRPNQEEQEGSSLVVMGRKGRGEGRKGLGSSKGVSLLSQERSLEQRLQASAIVVEEEGASCDGRHSNE